MGTTEVKFEQEVRLCWVPNKTGKLGLGVGSQQDTPARHPPDPPGRPWEIVRLQIHSVDLKGSSSSAQAPLKPGPTPG